MLKENLRLSYDKNKGYLVCWLVKRLIGGKDRVVVLKSFETKQEAIAFACGVADGASIAGSIEGGIAPQVVTTWSEADKGRSREKAVKIVGSGYGSVERASRVINNGIPEIVEAVDNGDFNCNKRKNKCNAGNTIN